MPPLNKHQLKEFLSRGNNLMKLATLTSEGWPYVTPVWYHHDGERFLVAGHRKARWVANLQSDARVSACIDTPDAPHTRVLVEGTAEIADMSWHGDWEGWSIRYLGQEEGRRYYEETRHIPRVLVRITPRKIVSWTGPGWHPRYDK